MSKKEGICMYCGKPIGEKGTVVAREGICAECFCEDDLDANPRAIPAKDFSRQCAHCQSQRIVFLARYGRGVDKARETAWRCFECNQITVVLPEGKIKASLGFGGVYAELPSLES